MRRPSGYLALAVAVAAYVGYWAVDTYGMGSVAGARFEPLALTGLTLLAVLAAAFGIYQLSVSFLWARTEDQRRRRTQQNLLRIVMVGLALVGVVGVLTSRSLGVLFSLGVVGFAATFALQQPLFSFIAWLYIMVKEPFQAGDRVRIGDALGDVVSVDVLVTRIWETDGDLVSTNQPSGRIITVPNSMVLSSQVTNFHGEGLAHVWNELAIQVAYETDLEFARERMVAVADEYLGDDMARWIGKYRERLAETPVELEVQDRPTVNVIQRESWLELKLRYLVHPRRGTRVRNVLYERVLAEFNEHPDRIKFPVGRSR